MKSCSERFMLIDSTHVSLNSATPSTADTVGMGAVMSDLADIATVETDSNNSLNEATEKTLRLDVGVDRGSAGSDVKMASPEKPESETGRKGMQSLQDTEEGVVDVGGDMRHHM